VTSGGRPHPSLLVMPASRPHGFIRVMAAFGAAKRACDLTRMNPCGDLPARQSKALFELTLARTNSTISHPSPLDFRRASVHTARLIRRPPMTTLWRLTALSDFATLADIVERLDEVYPPVALSWAIFEEGPTARLDVLFQSMPDEAAFRAASGLSEDISVEFGPLPEEDWVRLSLQGLKPVDAGRFTLFGAHDRDAVADGQIGIEIEAGPAFGTGHHGTTRGCLIAFSEMLDAGASPRTVFDLGCGTAVLAIAAAKVLPDAEILASDIDPEAVDESAENCTKNTTPGIDCFVAEGLDHPKLAGRQFELLFANILAGPLVELAPGVTEILAPGGKVILSGLLTEQEAWVRAAYEAAGLSVHRQPPLEGWETLIASKG